MWDRRSKCLLPHCSTSYGTEGRFDYKPSGVCSPVADKLSTLERPDDSMAEFLSLQHSDLA